ncbi:hypothetical protein M9458_054077, partial [Cirrhinus mrigala]
KALFEEGAFTSVPRRSDPASAEAERRLHSWGSQLYLLEGMETGDPLSPSSPSRSAAHSVGSEARSAVSSPPGNGLDAPPIFLDEVLGLSVPRLGIVSEGSGLALQAAASHLSIGGQGAYQADLLKELDEGEEIRDSDISELRRTADLSLHTTKESMAALVATERHLCLTLSDMKEKDRVFLLDALLSPSGLFGDAVNLVVDRYHEARKQAAVFQRFLPRRRPALGAAWREQPQPCTSSSHRGHKNRASPLALLPIESEKCGALSRGLRRRASGRSGLQISPTLVGPEQCLVMEQEVDTLLRKEAIKVMFQIRSEDWFVTIDLKDAYFHVSIIPQHRKFLRFAFRGKAYQFRVLPFSLALSRCTFTKCVDAALAPLRLQGIRILNYINDWLILAQLEQVAVQHRDVVPTHMKEVGLRLNTKKSVLSPLQRTTYLGVVWDSTTMQAHLSPARVDPHRSRESERGPVTHCQAVSTTAGSDGSCVQCDTFWPAVHETLQWWLKTRGFSPRGNLLQMMKVTRRCLRALDMWRKPWFLSQGPVLGAPCRRVTLATDASLTGWGAVMNGHPAHGLWSGHQLTWHINCLEMLAVFWALKHLYPLYKLAHQILVWSQDKLLSLRAVHVPGHLNMGADILSRQGPRPGEWMLHPEVVRQIWRVFGQAQVDLFATQENAQCPRWFSLTHPDPLGLDAMVQICRGFHPSPPARAVEALGVAPEGLSTEVVETILQSSAPSTRKLYALKWRLFTSWCGRHQQDPVNCPVGTVLEFLQDRLSAGLTHSTLKVYVAAIAAYHTPPGGLSVGKNPLVTCFLPSALRLRPPVRPRVPSWDLSVVLEALCRPPFEPIEEISDRHLMIKTVLLIDLSSLKRVGDLQALSVAPSFLDFAPGLAKAFLCPRAGYVPKVPSSAPRPVVLQAFCPPPFREPDQQKLNCMCPVKSDQLFVCYGPAKKGLPTSKQTLSRWIVDAICCAYESSGLPSPLGVKAHSTRSMAASKAFLAGISMQDICNAAGWFYDLDLRPSLGRDLSRSLGEPGLHT